ncbi:hypothetical protein AMTRI_Chr09g35670 [Amborella trichopoda]
MTLLLAFTFLVLIFTGEMVSIGEAKECTNTFTTPIFCLGAICRYSCRSSNQGHGHCDSNFKCTCTWPC